MDGGRKGEWFQLRSNCIAANRAKKSKSSQREELNIGKVTDHVFHFWGSHPGQCTARSLSLDGARWSVGTMHTHYHYCIIMLKPFCTVAIHFNVHYGNCTLMTHL